MKKISTNPSEKKPGLHPRNRHASRYDFKTLISSFPELKKFIVKNKSNDDSIDFANPEAVKALNRSILKTFYNINYWDIPKNYLCPPIPGRADYIHQVADLLGSFNNGIIPTGQSIKLLDIGVGANCVYPLIGSHEYEWEFVGADTDQLALINALKIIDSNSLNKFITLRTQTNTSAIFDGIIKENEFFDITISNPPFHSSAEDAQASSQRKMTNLNKKKNKEKSKTSPILNFGGQNNELICAGGELGFITRMIKESLKFKNNCFWFTTLVSKSENLPQIYDQLKNIKVYDFKTIDMAQGQKKSRIVAWTYQNAMEQIEWKNNLKKISTSSQFS